MELIQAILLVLIFFNWFEFVTSVLQNIYGIYKSIEITNNAFSDPNFFKKGIIPW